MVRMQDFRGCFTRSLYLASIVFALAHIFQILAMDVISQRSLQMDAVAIFFLVASGLVEGVVFFAVGWPVAYAPVRVMYSLFDRTTRRRLVVYVLVGFLFGLIFLPICASVAFFAVRSPDDPTYLARCIEFAYPMTIAGVIGGYAFWRFARRAAQNGELMVDQFS